MAALIGTLPIALGTGTGSETRRPLSIAIGGGLLFSQLLTLYLTPVFYTYMEAWREKMYPENTLNSRHKTTPKSNLLFKLPEPPKQNETKPVKLVYSNNGKTSAPKQKLSNDPD